MEPVPALPSVDRTIGPPVTEEVVMSRPLSVLLLRLRLAAPPPGAGHEPHRPVASSRSRRARGAVRRLLARQWELYQRLYLPPFPWEEEFLRWSGDQLVGELLPPSGRHGHDSSRFEP
jgi:hypothetical protein